MNCPLFFLFHKIALAVLCPLHFYISFTIILSNSAKKKVSCDSDRYCVESMYQFGYQSHHNNIKPPDPWAWNVFLCIWNLISFNDILQFSMDKSCSSFVKLVPKHFIYLFIFDANNHLQLHQKKCLGTSLTKINHLIINFILNCSLLQMIDFCILTLYPTNILNSFISFDNIFHGFLRIFYL